jgi:myo-inositol 2-dehydrogenase/D-chiro-inositol 1-dehydrogenase
MGVRVGFIGTGGMALGHLRCLSQIADAEVVAVCDVVREKAETEAAKYGAKSYSDYVAMLDEVDLDAVYVIVPPYAHSEIEILAAKRNINVFVERPVAASVEEGRQTADAIDESGVISAVGYHMRYYDTTSEALHALRGQELVMGIGWWPSGMPGDHWWRIMNQSGGHVVEETTQAFDLMRYVMGEVAEVCASVSAMASEDIPGADVPDVGTVTLQFQSGAMGVVSNTSLVTRGGAAGLHLVARGRLVEIYMGKTRVIEPGNVREVSASANPYLEENRAFIDAVRDKDRSRVRCDYRDGLKTLALTLAAYASAKAGRPVAVGGES